MSETMPEQEGAQSPTPEVVRDMPQHEVSHGSSHEPLWGMLLIAGMLIFVIASIAGIGWAAYSKWQSVRVVQSEPSITALSQQSLAPETVTTESAQENTAVAVPQEPSDSTRSEEAAKKLDISVLNGGAAKGSAGILAELLKIAGYAKVAAGNTVKDYTGVIIYYAANLEKEASVIKASVVKKYPQAKILPADTSNKETSVSSVTIIIGK